MRRELTSVVVAGTLGLTRRRVQQLVKSGELVPHHVLPKRGGAVFSAEEVARYVRSSEKAARWAKERGDGSIEAVLSWRPPA